jgi:hypothetical protein
MKSLAGTAIGLGMILLFASCASAPFLWTGRVVPAASAAARAPSASPAPDKAAVARGPALNLRLDPGRNAFAEIGRRYAALPGPGGAVLKAAVARIEAGTVLKGSCWDFVNACYAAAGYTGKRIKLVYSAKSAGPFADPALLRPGDWASFRNIYSGSVDHSAIFVEWLDLDSRAALTIDYPGEGRDEPGRYRVSELSKLWMIQRPADR